MVTLCSRRRRPNSINFGRLRMMENGQSRSTSRETSTGRATTSSRPSENQPPAPAHLSLFCSQQPALPPVLQQGQALNYSSSHVLRHDASDSIPFNLLAASIHRSMPAIQPHCDFDTNAVDHEVTELTSRRTDVTQARSVNDILTGSTSRPSNVTTPLSRAAAVPRQSFSVEALRQPSDLNDVTHHYHAAGVITDYPSRLLPSHGFLRSALYHSMQQPDGISSLSQTSTSSTESGTGSSTGSSASSSAAHTPEAMPWPMTAGGGVFDSEHNVSVASSRSTSPRPMSTGSPASVDDSTPTSSDVKASKSQKGNQKRKGKRVMLLSIDLCNL